MPNPSNYPAAYDNLGTALGDGYPAPGGPGGGHPGLHNEERAALNAIETTLGTNVEGGYDTLADRLTALELILPGGGGGSPTPGNDPRVFILGEDLVKGTAPVNFDLTTTPLPGLMSRSNLIWAVEPWSLKCEVFLAWQAIGVAVWTATDTTQGHDPYPWKMDHPAGSLVMVLEYADLNPMLFGARGDSVHDDWVPVQRSQYALGGGSGGGSGGAAAKAIVDKYKITKPVTVFDWFIARELDLLVESDFDSNCVQTNVTGNYAPNGHQAIYQIAESGAKFEASGGVLTFLNTWGNMSSNSPVRLTSMWSRQMPAGLVEGRLYKILTRSRIGTTQNEVVTLAEFDTPTTPITITGSGDGEVFMHFTSQIHGLTDMVTIESHKPNLDGYQCHRLNQPSRTRDMVLSMLAATGNEVAFQGTGDLSNHTNMVVKLGVGGNKIGGLIDGSANVFDSLTILGGCGADGELTGTPNLNAVGIYYGGKGESIQRLYVDGVGLGVEFGGCDSCTIEMGVYKHYAGAIGFARDLEGPWGTGNSWQVGKIQCDELVAPLIVLPGMPSFTTWDGSQTSGVGDTDDTGTFPGLYHSAGLGISLITRFSRTWQATAGSVFKMRRILKGLRWISDQNGEVWLPDPTGFGGMDAWIEKTTGSNNLVVRDHTGAQVGSTIVASGLYRYLFTDHWMVF